MSPCYIQIPKTEITRDTGSTETTPVPQVKPMKPMRTLPRQAVMAACTVPSTTSPTFSLFWRTSDVPVDAL